MKIYKVLFTALLAITLVGCTDKKDGVSNENNEMVVNDQDFELKYGTITDITGNDVVIKFGEPIEEEQETNEDEGGVPTGEAGMMSEAQEGGQLKLKYNDNEENVRLTSSIEIFGMGQEVTIKELKKGDIIQIEYYKNEIKKITIM